MEFRVILLVSAFDFALIGDITHQISMISAWEWFGALKAVITAVMTRVMTTMTSHLRVMT